MSSYFKPVMPRIKELLAPLGEATQVSERVDGLSGGAQGIYLCAPGGTVSLTQFPSCAVCVMNNLFFMTSKADDQKAVAFLEVVEKAAKMAGYGVIIATDRPSHSAAKFLLQHGYKAADTFYNKRYGHPTKLVVLTKSLYAVKEDEAD